MNRMIRALAALALLAATPGCFVVSDLDGYTSVDELGCSVGMALEAFTPHPDDRVVYDVIRVGNPDDASDDFLTARAVVDPLIDARRVISMPNAVLGDAHRLDLWVDVDNNGIVTTSPFDGSDHSWRFDVACALPTDNCTETDLDALDERLGYPAGCFRHVGQFDRMMPPMLEGSDLRINVTSINPTASFIEAHLVLVDPDLGTRRVVGLYRSDVLNGATTFPVVLHGMVLDDARYTIDFIIDLDGNGVIEPTAEVWTLAEANGSDYATPFDVDVVAEDPAGALPEEGILVSPIP